MTLTKKLQGQTADLPPPPFRAFSSWPRTVKNSVAF